MKKSAAVTIAVLIAFASAAGCIAYDNSRVAVAYYQSFSSALPKAFDGYTIALVTDFHNADNYQKVIDAVNSVSPDIICIAGDLVSMDTKNFANTRRLLRGLTNIADVYYTYGNHERWSADENGVPPVEAAIAGLGVVMLNGEVKEIEKDGESIYLVGEGDFVNDDKEGVFEIHAKERLDELAWSIPPEVFSVLLFHRAQYFDTVSEYPFNLVLSGHLHGGHINIKPICDRILKEHFGTAKYRRGRYFQNGTEMIVCGGTALKDDLPRIFNTPEIAAIELHTGEGRK